MNRKRERSNVSYTARAKEPRRRSEESSDPVSLRSAAFQVLLKQTAVEPKSEKKLARAAVQLYSVDPGIRHTVDMLSPDDRLRRKISMHHTEMRRMPVYSDRPWILKSMRKELDASFKQRVEEALKADADIVIDWERLPSSLTEGSYEDIQKNYIIPKVARQDQDEKRAAVYIMPHYSMAVTYFPTGYKTASRKSIIEGLARVAASMYGSVSSGILYTYRKQKMGVSNVFLFKDLPQYARRPTSEDVMSS